MGKQSPQYSQECDQLKSEATESVCVRVDKIVCNQFNKREASPVIVWQDRSHCDCVLSRRRCVLITHRRSCGRRQEGAVCHIIIGT